LYLGIDTATSRGSLALARSGELVAEIPLLERSEHARELIVRLHRLLEEKGLQPSDLRGVGVSVGPGSFTGVRIGMATAKGLAYALRVAAAGMSTLEALARAARRATDWKAGAIGAALGAGRGEIYWALFMVDGENLSRLCEDRSCHPSSVIEALPDGLLLTGDAAGALGRLVEERGAPSPEILDPPPLLAGSIALRAAAILPGGPGYSPGTLGPNYVRPAGAEVPRRRR